MNLQAILLAGGRASRMGGIDKPGLLVDGVSMRDRAIAAAAELGADPIVIVGPEPGAVSTAPSAQPDDSAPAAPSAPEGEPPGSITATTGPGDPSIRASAPASVPAGNPTAAAASLTPGSFRRSPSTRWVREDPPFSGPAAAVVTALGSIGADAAEWTLLLACDLPRPEAAVAQLVAGIPALDGARLADPDGRMQWLTGVYRTTALAEAALALPDGGRDQPVRALLAGLRVQMLPDQEASARDVDTWEDYEQLTKELP